MSMTDILIKTIRQNMSEPETGGTAEKVYRLVPRTAQTEFYTVPYRTVQKNLIPYRTVPLRQFSIPYRTVPPNTTYATKVLSS